MRSILKAGMLVAMLAVLPVAAQAGTLEGVAIGAGTGAVVADLSRCRRRRHRRRGRAVRTSWTTAVVIAIAGSATMATVIAAGAERPVDARVPRPGAAVRRSGAPSRRSK